MSLRLLQKTVAGGDPGPGAGRGRGRGAGGQRAGQRMSLKEFQEQVPGPGAGAGGSAPSRPSAWGRGGAAAGAASASPISPAGAIGARGAPPRRPAEPKRNAWASGPPPSAVDALWSAPAATAADAGEDGWDEPVEEAATAEDWGEDPEPAANGGWGVQEEEPEETPDHWEEGVGGGAAVAASLVCEEPDQGSSTTAGGPGALARSATASSVEADGAGELAQDVAAWLRHMRLAEYSQAVLSWCEEMGAASLEEVVESLEELVEALELKPLQQKRLLNGSEEALQAVRAGGGSGEPPHAASAPAGLGQQAPSRSPSTAAGAAPGGAAAGTWQPGGGSFYDRSAPSSGPRPASNGQAAPGPSKDLQSFYTEQGSPGEDEDDDEEDVYIKQQPTAKATWEPQVKVGQGARKKQVSQQQKAQDELEERKRREKAEAERKLQEQLQAEKAKAREDALSVLRLAAGRGDPIAFRAAAAVAPSKGVTDDEVKEIKKTLDRAVKERQRLQEAALCALQAATEAAQDEGFGAAIRSAIEEAADSKHLSGYAAALAAAEDALRKWDALEDRRCEAKMALQLALRRGEAKALEIALEAAEGAGLLVGGANGLVLEAQAMLLDVRAKERADAEAAERLRLAILREDIGELELAAAECRERHLPLHGAEALLVKLREKAKVRSEATSKLQRAMDNEDPKAIRAALEKAREADVDADLVQEAEACIEGLEAAAKRRENATVELHLARRAKEIRRLEAAISEGRTVGLAATELRAAQAELDELLLAQRRRQELRDALDEAMAQRELDGLRAALKAAEGILSSDCAEVTEAWSVVEELEEEARLQEAQRKRSEAESQLRAAMEDGDWDAIVAAQARARDLIGDEEAPILAEAAARLEELRDAHEHAEAERIVHETNSRLSELKKREASLAGSAHKKERNAIGKQMMALRGKEEYLSAMRFLRAPDEERGRRKARALELQKKAAEERVAREKRQKEASEELSTAIEKRDEDAVRALLVEEILSRAESESAEAFLADQEARRVAAEKDASLCEFSFTGLDKRSFFQASVAINDLFTEKYAMQEGTDFKLKVLKACNSVLVAFRSAEIAAAVRESATAQAEAVGPGRPAHVVASADIRGPGDFTAEAEDSLPSLRQDAEILRKRPARPEVDRAIRQLRGQDAGPPPQAATPSAPSRAATYYGSQGKGAPPHAASDPGLMGQTSSGPTPGGRWAQGAPQGRSDPSPGAPGSSPSVTGGRPAAGKGGGGGAVGPAGAPARSQTCTTSGAWGGGGAYAGKAGAAGRGAGGGGKGSGEIALPLAPLVAAAVQMRRATFDRDLLQFAAQFRVQAELRGPNTVVMRPVGVLPQDALHQAQVELQNLLDFYGQESCPAGPADTGGGGGWPESPDPSGWPRCSARLRVDAERGAGIELTATEHGYRVDHVEDFPGQDFACGDIIVEVEGHALPGLSEEAMEDTFGECFGDGVELILLQAPAG